MKKTMTIKLRAIGNMTGRKIDDRFIVDTVTDSAEYLPGSELLRPAVEELCRSHYWKVTIVEPKGAR